MSMSHAFPNIADRTWEILVREIQKEQLDVRREEPNEIQYFIQGSF